MSQMGRAAVGVAGDARVVVHALEFEVAEEFAVERQRDRGWDTFTCM
jgi:hypothetical protein